MWIGRSFRDLLLPRIQPLGDAVFAEVFRREVMPLTRTLVQARDARVVMLELSLVNQKLDGVTVAFLGFARDVTQREESQKELRRSQRQLADTQRIAQLGSWEHDLMRDRLWWSEEHYRLFGFDPSERVTRERFRSRLPPDQLQKLNAFDALLAEKGEGETELHFIAADGTTRMLNCVGRLERNSDGHPIRVFGSAQDVTERRRDERRLRESDERFRLMSRATNDVVWDWNLSSDVCWWGDGLHAFGYDAAGFSAIDFWRSRIHPEDAVRVDVTIAAARRSQAPSWVCDYRFRRADGAYAYVLDRAYIVRDEQEVAVRMVGAITDMTERRKMQEQLAEANRLSSLGRVAASVAHEFNNVLMGMQSNLEVLRRRAPVQLMKTVEHILHSVRRGKRITDEVLACTRRTAPSLQDVLVATFLTQWQAEIRPVLGPSIELVLEVAPELYMRADPLQIAQVLTNLALNGRDAMAGGGLLQITAGHAVGVVDASRSTGAVGYVHFQVRDHGAGMSPDDLSHIFEPLFTTKHEGTGLGLAVSYQIITRHEGFISAESEPGQGTTFNLLLPAALVGANLADEAPMPSVAWRSIVIVDDDESVVAGLKALLELDDIRVGVATRGGQAIPLLETEMPDAVILDIGLPDMNGSEVYERIAQRWPRLPVLFASGHADAARLDAWLQRPNVGFLLKPYDYAALRLALTELVGDSRAGGLDDSVKNLHVM
jgi:PAS domain S-box-containing protein